MVKPHKTMEHTTLEELVMDQDLYTLVDLLDPDKTASYIETHYSPIVQRLSQVPRRIVRRPISAWIPHPLSEQEIKGEPAKTKPRQVESYTTHALFIQENAEVVAPLERKYYTGLPTYFNAPDFHVVGTPTDRSLYLRNHYSLMNAMTEEQDPDDFMEMKRLRSLLYMIYTKVQKSGPKRKRYRRKLNEKECDAWLSALEPLITLLSEPIESSALNHRYVLPEGFRSRLQTMVDRLREKEYVYSKHTEHPSIMLGYEIERLEPTNIIIAPRNLTEAEIERVSSGELPVASIDPYGIVRWVTDYAIYSRNKKQ